MNTISMALDYMKRAGRCLKESKDAFQDVSDSLEFVREKFPDWFSSKIPDFKRISKDLSKKRDPALYGYEAQLRPASDIFSRNDAEEALMSAEDVLISGLA